jgi:hypothetical protein
LTLKLTIFARRLLNDPEQIRSSARHGSQSQTPQLSKVVIRVTLAEELLNQLANAEKRMAELEALAHGVKQFSGFRFAITVPLRTTRRAISTVRTITTSAVCRQQP